MKSARYLFLMLMAASVNKLQAQDNSVACKVQLNALSGTYTGGCKDGLADGKGEARGTHSYTGLFKKGLPNGKGVYNFSDSVYYDGNFQEGIKEGKGELHYVRAGKTDSIIKGYWSADEFRGKSYVTYIFNGTPKFDFFEVVPSANAGNAVTFELATTSAIPVGGQGNINSGKGDVLSISNLVSTGGTIIRQVSSNASGNKFSATYEISGFPAKMNVTLSSGDNFELELFKSARWKVKIYMNR